MATTLLPFRDYDEHDVINLFGVRGELTKGHIVKMTAGWQNDHETALLGDVGGSFTNTNSNRYGVTATIAAATGSGEAVLGMLLHYVKETDENGEKLAFNPRKAAEMGVCLSGQAAPVLTRGVVLYSGSNLIAQTPAVGTKLYWDASGELNTGVIDATAGAHVGVCLGGEDENGHVLVRINL